MIMELVDSEYVCIIKVLFLFAIGKISPNIKAEHSNKEEVFLNTKCQWINALRIQNGWLGITSNRLM